jgi:hypothetical protein
MADAHGSGHAVLTLCLRGQRLTEESDAGLGPPRSGTHIDMPGGLAASQR